MIAALYVCIEDAPKAVQRRHCAIGEVFYVLFLERSPIRYHFPYEWMQALGDPPVVAWIVVRAAARVLFIVSLCILRLRILFDVEIEFFKWHRGRGGCQGISYPGNDQQDHSYGSYGRYLDRQHGPGRHEQ